MDCSVGASVKYYKINIPAIDYLPDYFGTVTKAKIYIEAGPIVGYTIVWDVVSTMECYLAGERTIGVIVVSEA